MATYQELHELRGETLGLRNRVGIAILREVDIIRTRTVPVPTEPELWWMKRVVEGGVIGMVNRIWDMVLAANSDRSKTEIEQMTDLQMQTTVGSAVKLMATLTEREEKGISTGP